jgi:hypothetical protein
VTIKAVARQQFGEHISTVIPPLLGSRSLGTFRRFVVTDKIQMSNTRIVRGGDLSSVRPKL